MMTKTLYKNTNILNIKGEKQCQDWMMFLMAMIILSMILM